jgi:NAD(P)-dependent dehydrogenase (short-subunit alcohol dehydrogenase family)
MSETTAAASPVALVTGATSGIGRAVAVRLGADAMTVIVHGRDADRGAATVQEVEAAGGRARFVAADLGDAGEVSRLAAEAGEVDVLVNNGGISWFGPTAELDVATFDRARRKEDPRCRAGRNPLDDLRRHRGQRVRPHRRLTSASTGKGSTR